MLPMALNSTVALTGPTPLMLIRFFMAGELRPFFFDQLFQLCDAAGQTADLRHQHARRPPGSVKAASPSTRSRVLVAGQMIVLPHMATMSRNIRRGSGNHQDFPRCPISQVLSHNILLRFQIPE
jgi:hypothetical protein